jgi:uncharacterized membrane protein YfcA
MNATDILGGLLAGGVGGIASGFLGITSGGILVPLLVLILGKDQHDIVPAHAGRRRVYQTACGTASKRLTTISRLVSSTRTVMSNRPS